MFHFLPALGTLTLAVLTAPGAAAQTPPTAAAGAAPGTAPPVYRSAFEGYRPFTEEKIAPWRESNDTVGRIGGWRAYAEESRSEAPSAQPATPSSSPPAAQPAAPAARNPHAGHGKH